MEKYTTEQRTQIVKFYYQNGMSIILTQRAYRRHYGIRDSPSESMIRRLIGRFEEQGAVQDRPRTGRPRTATSEAAVERVRESIAEDPSTSTRRRSGQVGMSQSSLRRILTRLNLFPYKIQLVQQLKPPDFVQRLQYAVRFQDIARGDPEFIHKLIMSDEAHFHLNGFINKQNCRIWGTENPRVIHQRELHPQKCTVWCGVMSQEVIGPYFFEDDFGNTVSVTGKRYRSMIENFLHPAVQDKPGTWFQQDGATPHTARDTIQLLRHLFEERIISRGCEINWPSRSPDLTAADFFLWGYLKERVYVNKPQTLQHLKNNIEAEIRALGRDILRGVMENTLQRALLCEAENGRHLSDIIFHT